MAMEKIYSVSSNVSAKSHNERCVKTRLSPKLDNLKTLAPKLCSERTDGVFQTENPRIISVHVGVSDQIADDLFSPPNSHVKCDMSNLPDRQAIHPIARKNFVLDLLKTASIHPFV